MLPLTVPTSRLAAPFPIVPLRHALRVTVDG
jgi:hypothetical protein